MPPDAVLLHSSLPFRIQPCQADHGETTLIVDSKNVVVASIPSAVWNEKARLVFPQDLGNAALILQAVNSFYPLKAALKNLHDLVVLERRITYDGDPDMRQEYAENVGAALDGANQLLQDLVAWQDEDWFGKQGPSTG
ncbi:hypothetical protein LJR289_004601 [Pseudoduganella sp. LjRoot289]|uniref:hypothetical protein n=1 Tax=Pseudoduganella sp. LjRoot289 TaxID=3342314 RepID=UPI003ECF7072